MQNKTIMHIAHYAAPYMGNFIESLVALEAELKSSGNRMIYVFPETCKNTAWIHDFSSQHIVYFVESCITKHKFFLNKKVICNLIAIFEKEQPDIIHSHFDGYDIPILLAKKKLNLSSPIIWHHHNPKTLMQNPIKRTYQKLCLYRQYQIWGKQAYIIPVSDSCFEEVRSYGFDMTRAYTINNGICETRIRQKDLNQKTNHEPFTFLCFGGRGDHKGIDILLNAVKLLKDSCAFKLILVKGSDTEQYVASAFGSRPPSEIQLIAPVENINILFDQADCFISSSRRETFSYAVHEAALYGLPIISSDIPALQKINQMPSVFTFPNQDSDALASQMKTLILNQQQDMFSALYETRKYVEDHLTIRRWAQIIIEQYTVLLKQNQFMKKALENESH